MEGLDLQAFLFLWLFLLDVGSWMQKVIVIKKKKEGKGVWKEKSRSERHKQNANRR